MKTRSEIHAADLYVLLQRELRRRQSPQCDACYMQLPFRVDRSDADSPNWEVVLPADCRYACRGIIEDLVEEFGQLYDLSAETRRDRA